MFLCLTGVCTVFRRSGNSRFVILGGLKRKFTVITIVGCVEPYSVMKRAGCGLGLCGPLYAVEVSVVFTGWFCPMVRQLVGIMPLLSGIFFIQSYMLSIVT